MRHLSFFLFAILLATPVLAQDKVAAPAAPPTVPAAPAQPVVQPAPDKPAAAPTATDKTAISEDDIIRLLEESADWYKVQQGTEALASGQRESAFKESLTRNGENTLRRTIDFATAETQLATLPSDKPAGDQANSQPANQPTGRAATLLAAAAQNDQKTSDLQAALRDTNAKIARASGRSRAALLALRDKQSSERDLAKAQSDLLKTLAGLYSGAKAVGAVTLSSRIDEFQKLLPDTSATQKAGAKVVVADTAKPDDGVDGTYSDGIFGLGAEALDLVHKQGKISDIGRQSNTMRDAVQDLLGRLRDQLRAAASQGDTIAKSANSGDLNALGDQKRALDALVANFKQLSAALTPLAEANAWVEASQRNLSDWDRTLDTTLHGVLRALTWRIVLLLLTIAIPLLLSEIARRANERYVQDERRKRLFGTLRRSIVTVLVVVAVCLNFFSEFGSLATYAGLLTAGIAVALQNVILSLVAHFFFVGRFGVKVGDRVSVSGVTGDIVEIGWVRLYLMEISDDAVAHPTGRIVAFPNSILFNQGAFYKQIPGTHYSWHAVTVPLPAGSDYQVAQQQLLDALRHVYDDYADSMRQQQSILEHSTRLKIALPAPEARLKFADGGLSFEGRYPVEFSRATEIDDRVTRALLDTMRQSAELKDSKTLPKIESVD